MNLLITGKSHTGWRAIARRLGLRDIKTARRWAIKFSIPVIKFGKLVVLDEDIYRLWFAENIQIRCEDRQKRLADGDTEGAKG